MSNTLEPVHHPMEGMLVVCFQMPGRLFVGRIQKIQKQPGRLEIDLLWPNQYDLLEDTIWKTYFYRREDAPRHEGIFVWPRPIGEHMTFHPAHHPIHLIFEGSEEQHETTR